MSTVLLALALLIGLGITVFLISLGLTGLGVLLAQFLPVTPFEGAVIHLVLFSLAILLIGLTLLFERIKDSLGVTSAEDEEPLDEMLDLLKRDRNNVEPTKPLPFRREDVKVGRNDPCPCGSGKKYKFCCLNKV